MQNSYNRVMNARSGLRPLGVHYTTALTENFFELADISEKLSLKLISEMLSGKILRHNQCAKSFSG